MHVSSSSEVGAAEAASSRKGTPLFRMIRKDIAHFVKITGRKPRRPFGVLECLLIPGVLAVVLFRFESACHRARLRPLSRMLYLVNYVLFSVDITSGVDAGAGLVLPHPSGVVIAGTTVLGENVIVMSGVMIGAALYLDDRPDGFPRLGDGCLVGAGAKIFGPVTLGEGARVGANSVVFDDVPRYSVAVGAPARVVRYLETRDPHAKASDVGQRQTPPTAAAPS